MLRCLIVDDEEPARQRLRRLLDHQPDVEIVGEAADGLTALEQVTALTPDVVFLDVDMPELDGLGVAAALPPARPALVFVTAFDEHAVKAFELAAVDYLVKPVRPERLAAALARVRARHQAPDLAAVLSRLEHGQPVRRMAVRSGARFVVFDPSRVCAILARDHYSALLVDGKELLADDPLDTLAQRFDARQFLRVHRSGIVNLAFLKELQHEGDRRYVAVLMDAAGTRVPISRERLPAVKAALGIG